jgi:hypothetical protein
MKKAMSCVPCLVSLFLMSLLYTNYRRVQGQSEFYLNFLSSFYYLCLLLNFLCLKYTIIIGVCQG